MIVASEFWLSSPWLLVMLLESPSLCQPDSGHSWRDWRTDAKRCSVYPLIAVVKLNKFWSTLRVVPYLWEILAPPLRDIHQWHALIYIKSSNISLQNIRLVYTLTKNITWNHPICCTIGFHRTMFSIITYTH